MPKNEESAQEALAKALLKQMQQNAKPSASTQPKNDWKESKPEKEGGFVGFDVV